MCFKIKVFVTYRCGSFTIANGIALLLSVEQDAGDAVE